MNPRRIAIVGKLHAGKSTLAMELVDRGYIRISFADPLKDDIVSALNLLLLKYRLDDRLIDRHELESNKSLYRPFLQWLGTEFFREHLQRPNHWIDQLRDRVNQIDAGVAMGMPDVCIVCDDVRFENEVQALKALGFSFVRVVRDESLRRDSAWRSLMDSGVPALEAMNQVIATFDHATEQLSDEFDVEWVIHNNSISSIERAAVDLTEREFAFAEDAQWKAFKQKLP